MSTPQNPFASPGGSRQSSRIHLGRPDSSSPTPWQGSPRHSVDGGIRPGTSTPFTYNSVVHGAGTPVPAQKRRFKSYRLREDYAKPWLEDKDMKKTRWNNVIVGTMILLGFAAAGVVVYFMSKPYVQKDASTPPIKYCLIYQDDFQTLDKSVWSHEVQLDGFGNHAFDWTTTDERNSYVDGDGLHIVPTLTTETTSITADQMYANYTLSLDADKSCTGAFNSSACVLRSDPKEGLFVPPVRSARLVTKGTRSIRYGMVEVVARMPKGDWLWPAIWMMPEGDAYGAWPRSGEIDIMESRGNGPEYSEGGRNWYYGTLHWGPTPKSDAYWKTTLAKKVRRGAYSDRLHTFGIQWTPSYIYFYIDSKIHQILFIGFDKKKPLYEKGGFAQQKSENDTLLDNPWQESNSTTGNAPFDQPFYLILNVAVGGTNGFFLDNVGEKPWVNGATNARWSFWDARDKWLPTWGEGDERGMTVRSVKMWQLGACGSKQEL